MAIFNFIIGHAKSIYLQSSFTIIHREAITLKGKDKLEVAVIKVLAAF
jgi:hypothetical protein